LKVEGIDLERIKPEKEVERMKRPHTHNMNLEKMEGEGDFACPGCGNWISPDDCSEKTYTILEMKMSRLGFEELVVRCCKCASQINLSGFSILGEFSETERN